MTRADLDLARRLAAVPGIWRAGMVTGLGCIVSINTAAGCALVVGEPHFPDRVSWAWVALANLDAPDLDDGPTRGALLDVAREMWRRPDLHACPLFSLHTGNLTGWRVAIDEHTAHHAPTEGAAIAAAILAAPIPATTPPPAAPRHNGPPNYGYPSCRHCGHVILGLDGACPSCRRHPFLP